MKFWRRRRGSRGNQSNFRVRNGMLKFDLFCDVTYVALSTSAEYVQWLPYQANFFTELFFFAARDVNEEITKRSQKGNLIYLKIL